jgi:hypothetical protein
MSFFKKNKELKNVNYLELTPVRNYKFVTEEDGRVSVLIPRFTNKILVNLIGSRMKNPDVKVILDEFGSGVWLEVDGTRNVSSICELMSAKFGERIHPAVERVTKYFSQLYNYQIISFKELNKKG